MWLDDGDNSWVDGGYGDGGVYVPDTVDVPSGSATRAEYDNGWGSWLQGVTSRIVDAELFKRTVNVPGAVPPGYIMTRDGRLVRAGVPALGSLGSLGSLNLGGLGIVPLLAIGVAAFLLLKKG